MAGAKGAKRSGYRYLVDVPQNQLASEFRKFMGGQSPNPMPCASNQGDLSGHRLSLLGNEKFQERLQVAEEEKG